MLVLFLAVVLAFTGCCVVADGARWVPIGEGWARNSVNTVIFRTDALTTHGDTQYAGYYDGEGRMVLAKRKLGSEKWEIRVTRYRGNVRDAHCSISMMVDGDGYVHVSWGHHSQKLQYAKGLYPGSLMLSDMIPMTGENENAVTYPEFFKLPSGDMIFMYRNGVSGGGDSLLNYYSTRDRAWRVLQHPVISGGGKNNAYTNQIAVDSKGVWHLSWNWRETGDIASNHDICYARSADQGRTWTKSNGEVYELPITEKNAEVVVVIPQGSELINTTTTAVDSADRPMIATYWRAEGEAVPNYHLIRCDGARWRVTRIGNRTLDFTMKGGGTKRIPISRPKLAVDSRDRAYVLFRDAERGEKVSLAISEGPAWEEWRIIDLTADSVGSWEPNYDTQLWQRDGLLHVFVQKCGQGDGETLEDIAPQMVSVLEWKSAD